jgi:hypothetical protein
MMWKETIVTYYPTVLLEEMRKTTKILRIAGLGAEMWTPNVPNTKQHCYQLEHDV